MKHTKGEWYASESVNLHEQRVIAVEGTGQTIAVCYGVNEVAANAHLIAAAPELLEMCKRLFTDAVDSERAFDEDGNIFEGYRELSDIINKAENI